MMPRPGNLDLTTLESKDFSIDQNPVSAEILIQEGQNLSQMRCKRNRGFLHPHTVPITNTILIISIEQCDSQTLNSQIPTSIIL